MSEKYWTAEDLADHGYRLEQAPEDQAEQDDAYCITGADEPLSQRVNKRSREYIFKMSLRVVCIVCAVLVDGWMRWAFVAGSAVLPWAAVVIANGEAKNRNSGFVPYKHNVPQLALTASMQGQDSGSRRTIPPRSLIYRHTRLDLTGPSRRVKCEEGLAVDLLGSLSGDAAPTGDICSRKGCTTEATHQILWNNPKIHTPQRRKIWLACDEHTAWLENYLKERQFWKQTLPFPQ